MSGQKGDKQRDGDQGKPQPSLEDMYKEVGIVAVAAAAPYVKQSKPRRAA